MARNIVGTLLSSDTKENDVVGADSLRFTTAAGYAAAVTAVVGALLPVLDKVTALSVSENIKIAMLGLVGAGVLAYAVASAGDVVARAYATAHVHPAEGTGTGAKPPRPAAEYIAEAVIEALTKAAPAAKTELKAISTALSTSRAGTVFPMSAGVDGKGCVGDAVSPGPPL